MQPAGCLGRGGAVAIVVVMLGCAVLSRSGAATMPGGPPPEYARIWLYRDYQPYVSLARPYVRFNGRIVGISEPGGAFFRDVMPGGYEITVDSQGHDVNQFAHATVVAGQQIYVEVDALRLSNCAGARRGSCRPTFYTLLRPPEIAASAMANSAFHGGK